MALSQRLEFRQTQSLVMTPQLMQAIKLLQLSNLDLAAFVEDELERNPLLERAAEDGSPADRGAEPGGAEPAMASASDAEQSSDEWLSGDLRSRTEIEQTLDAPLDNVFPEEPAEAASRTAQDAAPTAYTEWGGGTTRPITSRPSSPPR
jgi:RNA polymerase sigma-54 factor